MISGGASQVRMISRQGMASAMPLSALPFLRGFSR